MKKFNFSNFINWVLENPKSFSIVMTMGHIVSVILFTALLIYAIFTKIYIFIIISGLMLIFIIRNLYKFHKFKKVTGTLFDNLTINKFVYNKKQTPEEICNEPRKTAFESCREDAKYISRNKRTIKARLQRNNTKPKRFNTCSNNIIQSNRKDSETSKN